MNTQDIIIGASKYFGVDVTCPTKYQTPLWDAKCSVVRYLVGDKNIPYKDLHALLNCTSNELWLLRVHGDNKMMIPAFRNQYNDFVKTINP
jgi:uncharacterized Rossmann fold enzyme|tara:strand:+ start:665 stop:937 length:273 start_codon:yes stop_codon:yes gene_type:complete